MDKRVARGQRGQREGKGAAAALDAFLIEEAERLRQLEDVWWPAAVTVVQAEKDGKPDKEATDRVLAIHKQRLALLQAAAGRASVEKPEERPPFRVVYVNDWREAGQ